MPTRRDFFAAAAATTAATTLPSLASGADEGDRAAQPLVGGALPMNEPSPQGHYRSPYRVGLGGVAIGTGFAPISAQQSDEVMRAAWAAGVRYFDTSPWYGLGLSERRMGHFLADQPREEYVISTKVGRILTPTDDIPETMWKAPSPFDYEYDYTADGTRRSIEASLQRLGLASLDIVFIHDLAPYHFGREWKDQFDIAVKGAIPALTKMRDEGMIRGWGFGVNNVEPCLRALDEADPDIFLLAVQYSVVDHQSPLEELFPRCEERGVSIVVGAPLNSGFLAGKDRYNYQPHIPDDIRRKGERITQIAAEYGTDLRTVALHFCNAPSVVSSVIPGASTGAQVIENSLSMATQLPSDLWTALKREGLIAKDAPAPS